MYVKRHIQPTQGLKTRRVATQRTRHQRAARRPRHRRRTAA